MIVKVRVRTNARKEIIMIVSEQELAITVKEKPLENRANLRVFEIVAAHFHVPVNRVRMIRGHKSPSKVFSIE
ncbi:MAG: DUF167 domain-containing protein [bacterium]|nr:DUF167 domain-containing protein [bacterium]